MQSNNNPAAPDSFKRNVVIRSAAYEVDYVCFWSKDHTPERLLLADYCLS